MSSQIRSSRGRFASPALSIPVQKSNLHSHFDKIPSQDHCDEAFSNELEHFALSAMTPPAEEGKVEIKDEIRHRARFGRPDDSDYSKLVQIFIDSKLESTAFFGRHLRFPFSSIIEGDPEEDDLSRKILRENTDKFLRRFEGMKYETLLLHIASYWLTVMTKDAGEKVEKTKDEKVKKEKDEKDEKVKKPPAQRVYLDPDVWKSYVKAYLQMLMTGSIANASEFYERFILIEPYEWIPAPKTFTLMIQKYEGEIRDVLSLEGLACTGATQLDVDNTKDDGGWMHSPAHGGTGIAVSYANIFSNDCQPLPLDRSPGVMAGTINVNALAVILPETTTTKLTQTSIPANSANTNPSTPHFSQILRNALGSATQAIGSQLSAFSNRYYHQAAPPSQAACKENTLVAYGQPAVVLGGTQTQSQSLSLHGTFDFESLSAASLRALIPQPARPTEQDPRADIRHRALAMGNEDFDRFQRSPICTYPYFKRKTKRLEETSQEAILRASAMKNGGGKFDPSSFVQQFSCAIFCPSKIDFVDLERSSLNESFNEFCDNIQKFVWVVESDLDSREISRMITFPQVFVEVVDGYFEKQHANGCWKHALLAMIGNSILPAGFLLNDCIVSFLISFVGPSDWAAKELNIEGAADGGFWSSLQTKLHLKPTMEVNCDITSFLRNMNRSAFMKDGMVPLTLHRLCCACNSMNSTDQLFYRGCYFLGNSMGLCDILDLDENSNAWILCSRKDLGAGIKHCTALFYCEVRQLYSAYDPLRGVISGKSFEEAAAFIGLLSRIDRTVYSFNRDHRNVVNENLDKRFHRLCFEMIKLNDHGANLPMTLFTRSKRSEHHLSDHFLSLAIVSKTEQSAAGKKRQQEAAVVDYQLISNVDITGKGVEMGTIAGRWISFTDDDDAIRYIANNLEDLPYMFDLTSKLGVAAQGIKYLFMNTKEKAITGYSMVSYLDRPVPSEAKLGGHTSSRNVSYNVRLDVNPNNSNSVSLFTATADGIRKGERLVADPHTLFKISQSIIDQALGFKIAKEETVVKAIKKKHPINTTSALMIPAFEVVVDTSARRALAEDFQESIIALESRYPFSFEISEEIRWRFKSPSTSEVAVIRNHHMLYNHVDIRGKQLERNDPDPKNHASGKVVIIDKHSITFTRLDLKTIEDKRWLNDEAINMWIGFLLARNKDRFDKGTIERRSHIYNTHFMAKLYNKENYCYESVQRWSKHIDLFSLDKLIVPIHLPNHWAFIVVLVQLREIHYFDALGTEGITYYSQMGKYMRDELKRSKGEHDRLGYKQVRWKEWAPQQENGYDCGTFVCMGMDFAMDDLAMAYDTSDMPFFRMMIATSIVRGHMLY